MLLRELQERGYEGGLTQLKAWLARMKRVQRRRSCASRPRLANKTLTAAMLDRLLHHRPHRPDERPELPTQGQAPGRTGQAQNHHHRLNNPAGKSWVGQISTDVDTSVWSNLGEFLLPPNQVGVRQVGYMVMKFEDGSIASKTSSAGALSRKKSTRKRLNVPRS